MFKHLSRIPQLFSHDLKLNILSNHAEHPKGLALSIIHATPFYKWHPIAFFSRKMIPTESWYKTHDQELLAIVEAFKTWRHYLKSCKYKVLVLTDPNNLR